MSDYAQQLAAELNLSAKNVQGAIDLIDQGNTIPFIARYRKEVTGSMDDQVLRNLGDRLEYLRGLDKRKEEVTSSITEQGAMTPELTAALSKAKTLAEVEDLYRPYKPKRKTRASIAKARGLQPLADALFKQDAAFDPNAAAADYINEEVPDAAAALAGAKDIIAEAVSDDAACRAELRRYYRAFGRIISVISYDLTYTDDEGKDKLYIPSGKCVLTAPGAGRTAYGAVSQVEQSDGEFHTYAGRRVPKYVSSAEGNSRTLTISSRPLMIPNNKNPFIVADVLTD